MKAKNITTIGDGTCLTTCPLCGKELMSGRLLVHMKSKNCETRQQKNYTDNKLHFLKKKIKELEEKDEK